MARKTNWEKMFAIGLIISFYMVAIFFIEWLAWVIIVVPISLLNPTFGIVLGWILLIGIFVANFPILGKVAERVVKRLS